MPSFGWHFALTLLVIASLLMENERKKALMLLPFGILSDIDAFMGIHRATLHNIFVILVPIFAFLMVRHRKEESGKYFFLASSLLALHIFLDAFHTGVFLLYPLSKESYDFKFRLGVNEKGLSASFGFEKPGEVGEVVYVTTPSPAVPEVPLVNDGVELVAMTAALLVFAAKFIPRKEQQHLPILPF
ncbi:MAG: hypothetical protein N2V74_03185 [Candidatus Methanospirare jalkutatii]|nr:MAG: hypothetical protein N2V74_02675 [Candidatus Methanospirare jalkutatii]UYZ40713.1 MAG: hypothetical protein N2V74_03185 [Candidatus Methanospirare jalkutatii]